MNKKAEMGVGTLIIFIAMLLVAAVAAGVLIQTVGSLQEKSLSTGQQAESQISTNVETIEVSATDGRNQELTDFEQRIKLSPGSDPIKLSQVILTFNTKDRTATLKYRGTSGQCIKSNSNGYNTWNTENITSDVDTDNNDYTLEEDLDDDGVDDHVYLYATTGTDYLYFNLSSVGIINVSLGKDINTTQTVSVVNQTITDGTTVYGYVTLTGTVGPNIINSSLASVTFTVKPYRYGEGYFVAEYEQRGTNWVNGNLQRGDLIKLCYESPDSIGEDAHVRINFIPKIGTPTLTEFTTPEVMSTYRIYLYP